jgi:hypothetical protein
VILISLVVLVSLMDCVSKIFLPNVQALAPLGRGAASIRDDGLKLREAWPTQQPQRLTSRAVFGLDVAVRSAIADKKSEPECMRKKR